MADLYVRAFRPQRGDGCYVPYLVIGHKERRVRSARVPIQRKSVADMISRCWHQPCINRLTFNADQSKDFSDHPCDKRHTQYPPSTQLCKIYNRQGGNNITVCFAPRCRRWVRCQLPPSLKLLDASRRLSHYRQTHAFRPSRLTKHKINAFDW